MKVQKLVEVEGCLVHPIIFHPADPNIKVLKNFNNQYPAEIATTTIDHLGAQITVHVFMHRTKDPLACKGGGCEVKLVPMFPQRLERIG
jgi:hypothetical protein